VAKRERLGSPRRVRVLILGGTRFIGLATARRLAARRAEVIVFHRGQTPAGLPAGVRELFGNRAALGAHAVELRALDADAIIDTYAMCEGDARALVDLAQDTRARLVVLSSADVYRAHGKLWRRENGPPDNVPLTEEAPLREIRFPYRAEAKGPEDMLF